MSALESISVSKVLIDQINQVLDRMVRLYQNPPQGTARKTVQSLETAIRKVVELGNRLQDRHRDLDAYEERIGSDYAKKMAKLDDRLQQQDLSKAVRAIVPAIQGLILSDNGSNRLDTIHGLLENELAIANRSLIQERGKVATLDEKASLLEKDLGIVRKRLRKAETDFEGEREKANGLSEEIWRVEHELGEANQDLAKEREMVEGLHDRASMAETNLEEERSKVRDLNERVSMAEKELKATRQDLVKEQAKVEYLGTRASKADDEIRIATHNIGKELEKVSGIMARSSLAEEQLSCTKERLEKAMKKLELVKTDATTAKENLQKEKTKVHELEERVTEAKEERNKVEEEWQSAKEEFVKATDDLGKEQSKVKGFETRALNAEVELESTKANLNRAKDELGKEQEVACALRARVTQAEEDMISVRQLVKDTKGLIGILESTVADIKQLRQTPPNEVQVLWVDGHPGKDVTSRPETKGPLTPPTGNALVQTPSWDQNNKRKRSDSGMNLVLGTPSNWQGLITGIFGCLQSFTVDDSQPSDTGPLVLQCFRLPKHVKNFQEFLQKRENFKGIWYCLTSVVGYGQEITPKACKRCRNMRGMERKLCIQVMVTGGTIVVKVINEVESIV